MEIPRTHGGFGRGAVKIHTRAPHKDKQMADQKTTGNFDFSLHITIILFLSSSLSNLSLHKNQSKGAKASEAEATLLGGSIGGYHPGYLNVNAGKAPTVNSPIVGIFLHKFDVLYGARQYRSASYTRLGTVQSHLDVGNFVDIGTTRSIHPNFLRPVR